MRFLKAAACLGAAAFLLAGCGGNGKKNKDPELSGERISVMALEQQLVVDPTVADIQVRLPQPVDNPSWPQAGGYPTHAMYHLALGENLKTLWHRHVVDGTSGNRRLMAEPVVAQGKVFILGSNVEVVAVDAETGREVWHHELPDMKESRDSGFGGGVAYDNGRVFVTTGFGYLAALDAATGKEVWQANVGVPLRGAPSIGDGQVYAITHDNQMYVYKEDTGEYLWYNVGIAEDGAVLGAASPAISGANVVTAYSSGDLYAMRSENGRSTWTDSLTRTGRLTPLSSINDIDGNPVIDRDRVFAVSHGDRMVSIDMLSGNRVWERPIASLSTPWIAGDFIYLITLDGDLVSLYRPDGGVRWIRPLQKYGDPSSGKRLIYWSGPVLAGNRLIVVSSHGYVVSISPFTGEIIDAAKAGSAFFVPPVVANRTLYLLDNSGELYALR